MTAIGIPMEVAERSERRPAGDELQIESVAIDQAAEIPIPEWVRRWARERPTETAIVDVRADGTRAWSWSALDEAADRTAALLLRLGVKPGEAVAYQLPNWGEFVVLTIATLRIGAVCCPLMPIFGRREVSHALRRSKARVFVVPERFRGRDHLSETQTLLADEEGLAVEHVLVAGAGEHVELLSRTGMQWHDLATATEQEKADPEAIAARAPKPDAIAQLLFTSGTTGEPKGVLHRFDALTRAAAMEIEHLRLGRDDVLFIPSPLAHQTGFLYGMWEAFVLGATQLLQDVWEPVRAARALRAWGGSFVQAATPFLTDLVRVVEEGEPRPSALRIFVVTGAAVPRALAEHATSVLDTAVLGAWGSTESCLGTLAAPSDEPAKRWGTDGRALAGTQIRITDDEGTVLPAGEEGNFEVYSALPLRGLPRPPGPDGRRAHAGRLVPLGRPRDDRQRRLPADPRADHGRGQPRWREGARRRDRAAAAPPPGASRTSPSWRCPTRAWASAPARSSVGTDVPGPRGGARVPRRARGRAPVLARADRDRSTCCPATPAARSRSSSCASSPPELTSSTEKEPVR